MIRRLLYVFLVLMHARRGNPRLEGWAAREAHQQLGGGGGGPMRVGGGSQEVKVALGSGSYSGDVVF
jgi:hypothetical protein